MKAVILDKPEAIRMAEKPIPKAGEGMSVIRVVAAGICGSDIGAYRGTNKLVTYPRVIGHEIVGEIVSVSEYDNDKGLRCGDLVVVDPYLYCGHCYPCSLGRTNCCENLKVLGVHVDGGMCEYFEHPTNMLIPVPAGLDPILAAIAEPITISLHGLHRGKLSAGEHVVIFGAGPIGIFAAFIAEFYKAIPIVVDPVEARLDFLKEHGVENIINPLSADTVAEIRRITNGRMAEMVMEASGSNQAISQALEVVCNAGRVVYTGWPAHDTPLPTGVFTKKELDVRGARTSAGEFGEALAILSNNSIPVQDVISHIIPVDKVPEVIPDMASNPQKYLKVVVKMEG